MSSEDVAKQSDQSEDTDKQLDQNEDGPDKNEDELDQNKDEADKNEDDADKNEDGADQNEAEADQNEAEADQNEDVVKQQEQTEGAAEPQDQNEDTKQPQLQVDPELEDLPDLEKDDLPPLEKANVKSDTLPDKPKPEEQSKNDEVDITEEKEEVNGQACRAIVTGGTGATGKWMVKELVECDAFATVAVVVRKEKENPKEFWEIENDSHLDKLKQILVDYEKLDEYKEQFEGFTHGFCLLGTTRKVAGSAEAFRRVDYDYVVDSAKLMKAGGVTHFSLMTSTGSKANSWFLYPRTKGEAENACKEIGFEKLTIFQPGMLFGRNDDSRSLEKFFGSITPSYFGVEVKQVAAAMRANAVKPMSEEALEFVSNSAIKAWET